MPLKLLKSIIQSSNDALGDLYQKVTDPVVHFRDDVEKKVGGLFKRQDASAEGAPESTGDTAEGAEADEDVAGPVRAFVTSTTEAFEGWQRRIDERVKEGVSRMTHLGTVGTEVDDLKTRLAKLEARLERTQQD